MQGFNGVVAQVSGVFGEAVVSTAAGVMIALMLVPLSLFLTSCWIDQTFLQSRRGEGEDARAYDRHEAARRTHGAATA